MASDHDSLPTSLTFLCVHSRSRIAKQNLSKYREFKYGRLSAQRGPWDGEVSRTCEETLR